MGRITHNYRMGEGGGGGLRKKMKEGRSWGGGSTHKRCSSQRANQNLKKGLLCWMFKLIKILPFPHIFAGKTPFKTELMYGTSPALPLLTDFKIFIHFVFSDRVLYFGMTVIVDDHVCAARNDVQDSICINGGKHYYQLIDLMYLFSFYYIRILYSRQFLAHLWNLHSIIFIIF